MGKDLILIAGPCSAETRDQILSIADSLSDIDSRAWFRAGIWKPRTMPNQFEGVGEIGLEWLNEVSQTTGLRTMTEVASAAHIEKVLEYGIDAVWIGARTTTSPFNMQEIADALRGVSIPVFIKNPISPDINLWLGGIERIKNSGITELYAVHRGFSFINNGRYRQSPYWHIPIELKRLMPDIPVICDPSHIAGNRDYVEEIAKASISIGFDGLMIEVHNSPDTALTDGVQQITPSKLSEILSDMKMPKSKDLNLDSINILRDDIDKLDFELIEMLSKRMSIASDISVIKRSNNLSILQLRRWDEMLRKRMELADCSGLSPDFVKKLFELIHEESIKIQESNDSDIN